MRTTITSLVSYLRCVPLRTISIVSLLIISISIGRSTPSDWIENDLSSWNFYDNETVVEGKVEALNTVALACKSNVNISLGQQGYAVLTALTLVMNPQYPANLYTVDIMGPLTNTVYCDQLGQNLMVMVTEIPTGNSCMSNVFIEDKLAPVLTCTSDTLPCNINIDDIDFESYIEAVDDNCDENPDLWYSYFIQNLPCNPHHFTQQILVTWTATDASGNSSTCQDVIYLRRPALGEIQFPPNISVSCTDPDIDPEVTGEPTFGGLPIGLTCQLIVTHTDNVVPMCNGARKILRTWRVMDWCNSGQVTDVQEILIVDNTPPDVTCPVSVTINTNPGVCTATYTLPTPLVTDLCAPSNSIDIDITVSGIPGIFSPGQVVNLNLGTYLVTIRATDPCGNMDMCQYSVTVRDLTPPTLVCHSIVVALGPDGMATVIANNLDFPVSDNCGIASKQIWRMTDICGVPSDLLPNPDVKFCCDDIGTTVMVGFKVTDVSGNMSTCMFQATVVDELPPSVTCSNITVSLDEEGEIVINAGQVIGSSSDNCGIVTQTVTPTTFDCDDLGVNVVVVTVTDESGNTATCSANVTVVDEVPPIALCRNVTVEIENGTATISTSDINNGSSDNCGIEDFDLSQTTFDCDDEGENIVILTVTDEAGNTATCTATVTVTTAPPDAICQNITVYLDESGNVSITAEQVNNESTDDCGIVSLEVTPSQFDCDDLGANEVVLTVTDISGNESTCEAIVTVLDTIDPLPVCQDTSIMLDPMGMYTITPEMIDNGSTDNCTIVSLTVDPNELGCEDVGNNVVVLTVTDQSGNTATCTANVMVMMPDPPVAECQNLTVYLDDEGNVVIDPEDLDNGSSTQCGDLTFTADPDEFDCDDLGENEVVLTVTDETGTSSTCTAIVTVLDTVPPTALCENITISIEADGEVSVTTEMIAGESFDNCPAVTIDATPLDFTCEDLGDNIVTVTVTDGSGNTAVCTATVTIVDSIPPVAICQDIFVVLGPTGEIVVSASEVNNGSTDVCGPIILQLIPNTFDCEDLGENLVELIVTDAYGNADTCSAVVTVDIGEPEASCLDITVSLNEEGFVIITPGQIDGGSTSNCPGYTVTIDQTVFDCEDVGPNVVTLTVTDIEGNTSTCTSTVTVVDDLDPVCSSQDITVSLDETGNVSITAAQVDNGSSDNCEDVTLSVTPADFDCEDLGDNVVTLTVTDESGNTSTCTAIVTVEDNLPPVAECQDITITIVDNQPVVVTGPEVSEGSSDNCGDITVTVTPNTFDCDDAGDNEVIVTVTDEAGNTATCTATVTVTFDPPVALCQDITLSLGPDGIVVITPEDVDAGSGSDCDGFTLSIDQDTFDCEDVGDNIVTLTVTDISGNTSTCTSTVTITEDTAPICSSQDITVSLDEEGNAVITAAQVDNGSSDICSDVTLEVTPTDFTCDNIGPNEVVLTVTDESGNTSTCTAIVTVEDNLPPDANCQDITVEIDETGFAVITPSMVNDNSTDNCVLVILTIDQDSFDCEDVGDNIVILTVTDGSGNSSTCTSTVTVEAEPPVATCQDITISVGADGTVTIDPEDVIGDVGSNCGAVETSVDPNEFDCDDIGTPVVVTLTVTDAQGNTSTCTATVTVTDDIAPLCSAQDLTVYVDDEGNIVVEPGDINDGSTDNCGPVTFDITPADFTCDDLGENTVTLTVTDQSDNTSTCTAIVTVLDTIAPTALCQDITVSLNGDGTVVITAAQVNNGSTDNCLITSLEVFPAEFDCDDIGENVVTLTVEDASGNISTCTATVTVEDSGNLQAICQNVIINVGANGMASIDPSQINNGSGGGCNPGELEFDLSQTNFTCANLGNNVVVLTVTDEEGNTATCTAIVTVLDNIVPVITCPANVTVDCHIVTNPENTGQFGNATATDNCGAVVTETHVINLNNCNVGTITRTFTATDASGNTATCTQVVTVNNPDPFDAGDITWPASPVNVNICNSTNPNQIPNGVPILNQNALICADVSVTFSDVTDMIVDNNPNTPCRIITRTWTVTNNCVPVQTFMFVQTINVTDAQAPVFTNINDMTKVAGSNCTANFTLIANATDCAGVSITNNSPYGVNNGANASGNYPIGSTTVIFTATDGCGNTSTMDVVVTVVDPVPTEFECEKIIFILPEETEITVNARVYVVFMEGQCTDPDDFVVSYSDSNPWDTLRMYDCGDVGVTTFPLYFWNATGTMIVDSCPFADLDLRDPDDLCMDGLVVTGVIGDEKNSPLEGVTVLIPGTQMTPDMTNAKGEYYIDGFLEGTSYEIVPQRNTNHKEGVSTLDLVAIQKHLLGRALINSPYKLIAADANRSGAISALDIIEIRKLILGYYTEFPDNTSWRFVDRSYEFPDVHNPFANYFPESVWYDSLQALVNHANFIAIKTGDVNGSYFNNFQNGEVEIRNANSYEVIGERELIPSGGSTFTLRGANDQDKIDGLQLSLDCGELSADQLAMVSSEVLQDGEWIYDPSTQTIRISLVSVEPLDLAGKLIISWPVSASFKKDVSLANMDLRPEAYVFEDGEIETSRVIMNRIDIESPSTEDSNYELFQNVPNPFGEGTVIRFNLPESESVRLVVYDQIGRQMVEKQLDGIAGSNEVNITGSDLSTAGIYYYTLYTSQANFTRKMSFTGK